MKLIIATLLLSFCLIEAAHVNYHRAEERKAALNFDKNF